MKPSTIILTVLLFVTSLVMGCNSDKSQQESKTSDSRKIDAEHGLRDANERLYSGLNDMFEGNIDILIDLWLHSDEVTQMGPFGERLTGWDAVYQEFKQVAEFKLGGKIVCEDLHVFAENEMGYTVCVEVGENIDASGNVIKVSHRATNIFKLDNGEWKLVHHHTDISKQLTDAYTGE
jgi:ketosteroid isomerase-like protein